MTVPTETVRSSLRLWQLISPALPVGAFAYSQGQEYAVHAGWITDEKSAGEWIISLMQNVLAQTDVPVFARCYRASQQGDWSLLQHWNAYLLAMREAGELYSEDVQLGQALRRVLSGLEVDWPQQLDDETWSFVSVFAFACAHWQIPLEEAVSGYLWSWCENQVAAAVKLVPLGHTAGLRILSAASGMIPAAVYHGLHCEDERIGLLAPGLGIASALHETQYSRLFRS